MGWFSRKKIQSQQAADGDNTQPKVTRENFTDDSEPADSVYSVEFGTKLPIDVIYSFLKDNYENKGYNDALVNPDMSYKNLNCQVIRSDLEIQLKQVMLKYKDMLRNIDFHIKSRSAAGLTDIVSLLNSRKEICERHLEELEKMKQDFDNEDFYMAGIVKTYEAGFIRGLASVSLQNLKIDLL